MSQNIRIKDDTAYVINELGGTFDKPNDVIQKLVVEAGYEGLLEDAQSEKQSNNDVSSGSNRRKYVVELYKADEIVKQFEVHGHGGQSDIMASVTDYLIDYQNLMDNIAIPYASRGNKPLINDSAKEMESHRRLSNGYFLNTNYNSSQKKTRIEDLAFTECGLRVEFDGDW